MQREDRYIVIKKSDIESAIQSNDLTKQEAWNLKIIARFVGHSRERRGQKPLQCVVVESDWPEYEPVWNMIAARVDDHNASNGVTAVPGGPNSTVLRDYARYQFLRDKDAFGAENEPGLVGWDELTDLAGDEFDAAIDARMAHPDIAYTVPLVSVTTPAELSRAIERVSHAWTLSPGQIKRLYDDIQHEIERQKTPPPVSGPLRSEDFSKLLFDEPTSQPNPRGKA
jgi:hypothetical protein